MLTLSIGGRLRRIGVSSMSKFDGLHRRISTVHASFPISDPASYMKLLAWNLNHRAARRQIPSWIAAAINEQAPDILVLTEDVEGPDNDFFLSSLTSDGFSEFSCSTQPGRENQVLIASRSTQRRYDLVSPDIHPSVPSTILGVSLGSPELAVVGFRMPAFAAKERALKRLTRNWLLGEADRLRAGFALIVGDFN